MQQPNCLEQADPHNIRRVLKKMEASYEERLQRRERNPRREFQQQLHYYCRVRKKSLAPKNPLFPESSLCATGAENPVYALDPRHGGA